MRVTLDLTLSVELLGCGKVVRLRVDKETSLHVLDLHLDRESRIGFQSPKVLGEGELGRGHVVYGGNGTDGSRIAGASCDLLAVGDGQVGDGQTKVDEVVARCQGPHLPGSRNILAVILKSFGQDSRVDGQGCLRVATSTWCRTSCGRG